jgi:hypothetical protein
MSSRLTTARWTGVFYLGVAIAGFIGFLFVRSELFIPGDAAATLTNLIERPGLARLGIAADITIVLTQALAAMWFFKLFRGDHSFAAGSIAAFGLVNSAVVLVATVFSATALAIASGAVTDQASTVQVLYQLNGAAWDIGGLFFGLWLIPMGYVVVKSHRMPRVLGWVLIAGGIGYVLAAYVAEIVPNAPSAISGLLTGIASIGEFWMIGYLLIFGVRPEVVAKSPAKVSVEASL